jgi:very-short-patch-repair endonuclease
MSKDTLKKLKTKRDGIDFTPNRIDFTPNQMRIRSVWKKAFEEWTKEETDLIKKLYSEGKSIVSISNALDRQPRGVWFKLYERKMLNPTDTEEVINKIQEDILQGKGKYDYPKIHPKELYEAKQQKKIDRLSKITPYAIELYKELKSINIDCRLEYWDGRKHIDLAIPKENLFIEIDGMHHITNPKYLAQDLLRDYHNAMNGFFTIHIPNDWIQNNVKKVAKSISVVISILKDDSFVSDWLGDNPAYEQEVTDWFKLNM